MQKAQGRLKSTHSSLSSRFLYLILDISAEHEEVQSYLLRSYAVYRPHWLEQESIGTANCVRAITDAIGRMPTADRLCLIDMRARYGFDRQLALDRGLDPFMDVCDLQHVVDSVTAQIAVSRVSDRIRQRSWYLLQQLPIAISDAGVTWKGLHIIIYPPLPTGKMTTQVKTFSTCCASHVCTCRSWSSASRLRICIGRNCQTDPIHQPCFLFAPRSWRPQACERCFSIHAFP